MNYQNLNAIPMYPEYGYDDAEEIDRDMEYVKGMYPRAVRSIQREVDEECDKLEYDGSCMFDEYPSCEHLGTIVDNIYERIMDPASDDLQLHSEQLPPWGPPPFRPPMGPGPVRPPRPDYHPCGSPDWVRNLISVLLYNEMLQRRRRYRRRKRPYTTS